MVARLVVGDSPLARELLERLRDSHQPLLVCRADRDALEEIADEIRTVHGDPTKPETLAAIDADIQSVLALDDDPTVTIGALRAAETALPDAFCMGYTGREATADDRQAIEAHADRVVDATAVLGDAISDRVSEASARMRHLRRTMEAVDGELAIVTHDNPDPDAIASALALQRLAEHVGCGAEMCYFGSISHQENRAFVNVLDIDLTNLDAESDLDRYGGFALVDHSRPGVNDQLPEDTPVDIVIDHHPPRGPVEADFADLRSHVGATSTLLVEYLQQSTLGIDQTVATALLFGIRIDTDEFRREVCPADFEAGATLLETADLGALQRVESPSIAPETLETLARAITGRARHGPVVVSGVGQLRNRDALAQAADRLLNIKDVTTTLVYGIDDHTIYISARTRGADLDLGEALRDAFGQIGSAGGHADMAGAQIELGVLEDEDAPIEEVAAALVTDRFLEVLESRWNRPLGMTSGEQYLVESERVDTDVVVFPPDGDSIED